MPQYNIVLTKPYYTIPAARVKLPARNQIQNKRALTEAEKNAIRSCDFTLREKAFVEILYCTGMRRGEVLALTRNDINFKTNEITVNKSLAFINNNQPEIKTPKTKNSNRIIPMPKSLIETLKCYLDTIYYQGIDVKQAQLLLGHSNIKTTLEIYTHFITDEKIKEKLSEIAI